MKNQQRVFCFIAIIVVRCFASIISPMTSLSLIALLKLKMKLKKCYEDGSYKEDETPIFLLARVQNNLKNGFHHLLESAKHRVRLEMILVLPICIVSIRF